MKDGNSVAAIRAAKLARVDSCSIHGSLTPLQIFFLRLQIGVVPAAQGFPLCEGRP